MQSKSSFMNHRDMYLMTAAQSLVDTSSRSLTKINQIHKEHSLVDTTNLNTNNNNQQQQQQQHHKNDDLLKDTDDNQLEDMYNAPMYFGTKNSTVITTQIGATAHLPCTIHYIGEGVVSRMLLLSMCEFVCVSDVLMLHYATLHISIYNIHRVVILTYGKCYTCMYI